MTITSLLAALFESIQSSISRPLLIHNAVHNVPLVLISFWEWLIQQPPLWLDGSCKHNTSALCLSPVSCAGMVHSYYLMHLCWTAFSFGSQGSHYSCSPNVGFNCGRFRSLSHFKVIFLPGCLHFFHICHFRFPSPNFCSSTPRLKTKHHSICRRYHISGWVCGCPSCVPYDPALLCQPTGFCQLRASVAKCNVISFTVGALLPCVTAEWALHGGASHHVALVVSCPVMTWAVAIPGLVATLVLDVTPSTEQLTCAVRAHIWVQLDSVPHSCRLDFRIAQTLSRIAPIDNNDNQSCGDFSALHPLPGGAGLY